MENKNLFLETTLHNLTFHDSSSIFSITQKDGFIYTTGSDRVIRKWKIMIGERKIEFKYSTALNSSISLKYVDSFEGHKNTINCIRFSDFKNDFKEVLDDTFVGGNINYDNNRLGNDLVNNMPDVLNNRAEDFDLMASCGDSGEVLVWKNKEYVSLNGTDDDAICLCWNKNRLFVGFGSGRLNVYEISDPDSINSSGIASNMEIDALNSVSEKVENVETASKIDSGTKKKRVKVFVKKPVLVCKLLTSKKIHSSCIEGISFNPVYNILATQGRDATLKITKFDKKLTILSKFDKIFLDDTSKIILFRRCSFSKDGKFLFSACGIENSVHVIAYPFTQVYGKIKHFDSPVSTIVAFNDKIIMLSKRSLYLYDNAFYGLEYLSMTPITDACLYENILFVSAVDGFLYSVDINTKFANGEPVSQDILK